jgi:hypothetical protein
MAKLILIRVTLNGVEQTFDVSGHAEARRLFRGLSEMKDTKDVHIFKEVTNDILTYSMQRTSTLLSEALISPPHKKNTYCLRNITHQRRLRHDTFR